MGAGRAARKRKRKRQHTIQSTSLCHQSQYVRLMTFLHKRGFTSTLLQPALFTDTGRGLQTLQTIKPGGIVISLPESCLLTTSTVLDSYLGPYIKSWKPRLSPLLALCIFLVCEQHRGEASDWFPYIDVLPSTYTCPAYFADDVMAVLPASVQQRAVEQREAVREIHSANRDFFRSLQPVVSAPTEDVLTYEALRLLVFLSDPRMYVGGNLFCQASALSSSSSRWAWCSVNTRSVFMTHPPNSFLRGQDNYALAPFLDLLNHRPGVKVKASFNHATRHYEIRGVSRTLRYQQAFINYGSHDNQRLLLEYGFVATDNPHSVVYIETDLICDVLRSDRSLDQKIKFLRENQLLHNLTVSSEGPSWRLMTALRLLSLPQTLYHHWRAALHGQVVCEESEEWSVQTARIMCQRLLEDANRALDQIAHLLQQREQPIREQLDVVRSLRQEEKFILESCLEELNGSNKQRDLTLEL